VRAASVTCPAPARSFGVLPLSRVAARASAMPRGPLSEGESQHREAHRRDEAKQQQRCASSCCRGQADVGTSTGDY
jgi:hypothetical protein